MEERLKLYFVVTIRDIQSEEDAIKEGWPGVACVYGSRVVGYFKDFETAKKVVEKNVCDIYECGYYKYAVVEEVREGLYPSSSSEAWFYKWEGDEETGGYKPIEKPKQLSNTLGFSIG